MYKNRQLPAILLIEMDEVTLEIYQRELSKSFTVFAFTELNGALETLSAQDVQVLVIEPEICSGQGWDLIDSVHKSFSDRFIPVIVCSTRDPSNENLSRGITRYLTKPVLPKTLREKTLEVLELKEKRSKPS